MIMAVVMMYSDRQRISMVAAVVVAVDLKEGRVLRQRGILGWEKVDLDRKRNWNGLGY